VPFIGLPLLIDEILPERYRADDMASNVPILGLSPCSVNSEVLRLDVFIDCFEPRFS